MLTPLACLCRDFLNAACELLVAGVPLYGNQELSNVMWALVTLHHYPGRMLLEKTEAVVLRRLRHTVCMRLPSLSQQQQQQQQGGLSAHQQAQQQKGHTQPNLGGLLPPIQPMLPLQSTALQSSNGVVPTGTQPMQPSQRTTPPSSTQQLWPGHPPSVNGTLLPPQPPLSLQPQSPCSSPPMQNSLPQQQPSQIWPAGGSTAVNGTSAPGPHDQAQWGGHPLNGAPQQRPVQLQGQGQGPGPAQQQQQQAPWPGTGMPQQPPSLPQQQQWAQQQGPPMQPMQPTALQPGGQAGQQWTRQQGLSMQPMQHMQPEQQQQQAGSRGASSAVPGWVAGRGTPSPGLMPQDLANMLWSFGRLRYKVSEGCHGLWEWQGWGE